jgi:prevent-host-death family protein
MAIINVHEAKTQLSKLLDRAHAGQEVVICKAGKPYARLVPLEAKKPRKAGWLGKGKLGKAFFEPLPPEELAAWNCEREK